MPITPGSFIPRFAFWNPSTWAIPELYWDTFSQEQRIHAICKQLGKVIAYADMLGVNVDDISARLKAIEEGQLDPIIVAAIEEWFEDNQPEIMQALETLQGDIETINAIIGEGFTSENTVSDNVSAINGIIGEGFTSENTVSDNITAIETNIDDIEGIIGSGFTSENTVSDNIEILRNAHVLSDPNLKIRVVDNVNGDDDTAHEVTDPLDTSAMYKTLQKAFDDAMFDGSDIRIWFNSAGQYDLQTCVISGGVIHFMCNDNASGLVTIYMSNPGNHAIYIYDTHVNLTGTSNSSIELMADSHIQCEGSTFWANDAIVSCDYFYLIQGSMQALRTTFNCNIIGRYIQCLFGGCIFNNQKAADAIWLICSIVRFEVNSSIKCTIMQNQNGSGYSAIHTFTSMIYCLKETLTSFNEMQLDYDYFFKISSSLLYTPNVDWQLFSTYTQNGNSFEQLSILNQRSQQAQGGAVASTEIPANGYTDLEITYQLTFFSIPFVFVQLQIGSGTDSELSQVSAYVMNRTTTGCTIRLFNNTNSARSVVTQWRAEI